MTSATGPSACCRAAPRTGRAPRAACAAPAGRPSRSPCRTVVGVSGSPASLTALRRAGAEARHCGCPLIAVTAWEPPEGRPCTAAGPTRSGSATGTRRRAPGCPMPSSTPAAGCRLASASRCAWSAWPGPALLDLAAQLDGLLLLGTRPGLRSGPVRRHVRRQARCPVLTVPVAQPSRAGLTALRRLAPADFGTGGFRRSAR
ncbi:universal stress protein [Streptomyces olivaceoviridis]|uniref:universal stress protein n=1 Tax=Streptomyces olivaceoviridis TaxID=1921 RepID=UPI0036B45677